MARGDRGGFQGGFQWSWLHGCEFEGSEGGCRGLKTTVAFMNSLDGGTLLIGVAENRSEHGLDSDYTSRSKADQDPCDWFHRHLANIISASMGDAAATNVRSNVHHVDGHDVCRVQVDPSGSLVEAKVIYRKPNQPKETRTEFFVRAANGTRPSKALQAASDEAADVSERAWLAAAAEDVATVADRRNTAIPQQSMVNRCSIGGRLPPSAAHTRQERFLKRRWSSVGIWRTSTSGS